MNPRKARCITVLILFISAGIGLTSKAQSILVDEGVQAGGLWCFPVSGEPNTFKYLPSRAMLAFSEKSLPEFSFIRYVIEKPETDNSSVMNHASGGGVLHFLVLYYTPEEQIENARDELRENSA